MEQMWRGDLWVNHEYGEAAITVTLIVETETGDISFRT